MSRFTIYFATDVHGSERCFRKFLNAGKFYGADAVVLGGDVAGKALVPVIANPDGSFSARLHGKPAQAQSENELPGLEARIRALGFYPYRASPEDIEEFTRDPPARSRSSAIDIHRSRVSPITCSNARSTAAGSRVNSSMSSGE